MNNCMTSRMIIAWFSLQKINFVPNSRSWKQSDLLLSGFSAWISGESNISSLRSSTSCVNRPIGLHCASNMYRLASHCKGTISTLGSNCIYLQSLSGCCLATKDKDCVFRIRNFPRKEVEQPQLKTPRHRGARSPALKEPQRSQLGINIVHPMSCASWKAYESPRGVSPSCLDLRIVHNSSLSICSLAFVQ
jgi:hypothetical protein